MRLDIPKTTFPLLGSLLAATLACTAETPVDVATTSDDALSIFKLNRNATLDYHDQWRKLWEDHITWTRMAILGIFHDLPGTDAYTERLIQNYEDMEDALVDFYGEEATEELGDLLLEHLEIAAQILVAAKNGNDARVNALVVDWRRNGDELAVQMDKMNPKYWPIATGRPMWQEHLNVTLDEAIKNLTNDFEGELGAWESVHDGGLMMADFVSDGVIKQFPGAFGPRAFIQRPGTLVIERSGALLGR
jgi:hypothetical protein